MIQVNLVPEVKQKFLKAQRMKRLFLAGSFLISAAGVALVVLMFMYVNIVQGRHKTNLQKDIDDGIANMQSQEDLDKLLTVQSQLEALPGLHAEKPQLSRLSGYLAEIVTNGVTIDTLIMKFSDETFEVSGQGNNLKSVNTFVDTLKNARFKVDGVDGQEVAFSNVVLDRISVDEETGDATYSILGEFDIKIFSEQEKVTLNVPNITSTQSEVDRPKIFSENGSSE